MSNIKIKFGVIFALVFMCYGAEEHCSRYHYEEQILEKVVRLEHRLELLEDKVNTGLTKVPVKIYTDCPDHWIRFKGSCYLFEEKKYPFCDARSNCQSFGAELVHINDYLENEFLRQHLKTLKNGEFWIGLEDIDKEGQFRWVDDNTIVSYTDWGRGQPDDYGGKEDCVLFHAAYSYNWNDGLCHYAYGSICEMKAEV